MNLPCCDLDGLPRLGVLRDEPPLLWPQWSPKARGPAGLWHLIGELSWGTKLHYMHQNQHLKVSHSWASRCSLTHIFIFILDMISLTLVILWGVGIVHVQMRKLERVPDHNSFINGRIFERSDITISHVPRLWYEVWWTLKQRSAHCSPWAQSTCCLFL